jgi:hypothetical protein
MAPRPRFTSQRTLAPQPTPPGLYRSTYDPELGAAICRRVAAGESLRGICRLDAAMPTEKTVWNWARAYPEFAAMKAHALRTARAASLAAQGARDAARRAAVGAGPRVAWNAGRDGYDDRIDGMICARLMGGETLAGICGPRGMPSVGTVYYWLRRYPEFLANYRYAKARAPDIMAQDACDGLEWIGKRKSWVMMGRTIRASDKRARRLSLKRYAPPAGPRRLTVRVAEADGAERVIYDGGDPAGSERR